MFNMKDVIAWFRGAERKLFDHFGGVLIKGERPRIAAAACSCCRARRPCPPCEGACKPCHDTGSAIEPGTFEEGGLSIPFGVVTLILDQESDEIALDGVICLPGSGDRAPFRMRRRELAEAFHEFRPAPEPEPAPSEPQLDLFGLRADAPHDEAPPIETFSEGFGVPVQVEPGDGGRDALPEDPPDAA